MRTDALGLKGRAIENPREQPPREKPGLVLQADSRRENQTAHAVQSGQLLTPLHPDGSYLRTHGRAQAGGRWLLLHNGGDDGRVRDS